MKETAKWLNGIISEIDEFNAAIKRKKWKEHSNKVLWKVLREEIARMDRIYFNLQRIASKRDFFIAIDRVEIRSYLKRMRELAKVLGRNLNYEMAKSKLRERKQRLDEESEAEVPELYAELQHRLQEVLSQLHFDMQRLLVHLKKEAK
ncbi:MAG: hypothetical protein HYW05_03435 [Candidatus Diapherotrites archaeon]|nr:hypothetical protein [Candidatus Diapherotrites archaeon]